MIDEAAFLALVSWHHTLAQLAIAAVSLPVLSIESPQNREGEADAAAILFASITARSGDPELDWALGNAAARLGPFRRWESAILPRTAQELRTLRTAVGGRDRGKVSDLIARYHDRRRKFARQLVEAAASGHA
ncbi:hypothetical protein [Novosphingobium sp. 9]|uniref:hypothetical protein n=1 Tax=Novosphingobium sp. 9 TaxID=2025349 RepID=UPI0021B6CC6C|nr:hypothetical protein [Novosphingobium sp. 9]